MLTAQLSGESRVVIIPHGGAISYSSPEYAGLTKTARNCKRNKERITMGLCIGTKMIFYYEARELL